MQGKLVKALIYRKKLFSTNNRARNILFRCIIPEIIYLPPGAVSNPLSRSQTALYFFPGLRSPLPVLRSPFPALRSPFSIWPFAFAKASADKSALRPRSPFSLSALRSFFAFPTFVISLHGKSGSSLYSRHQRVHALRQRNRNRS